MKKFPAIAATEFDDIATGMHATDAMLKKAPVSFVRCGTVSRGRYLTLIGGSTASVDESFVEGLFHGGQSVIDSIFLPDIHGDLYAGIFGTRRKTTGDAVAIFQTSTVSGIIRAAEAALKATGVSLVEIRLADHHLHGKGVGIIEGDLHEIEVAVDAARSILEAKKSEFTTKIIPAPHWGLTGQIAMTTQFDLSEAMDLKGEHV